LALERKRVEGAPAAAADEAAEMSREARSAMSSPRDGGLSPPVTIAAAGPPRV